MILAASKTTALYARVSTNRQDHRCQMAALFTWLRERGLSWRDCRWYRDKGVSSGDLSRPAFDRLMEDVAAGKVKELVVYKLDRVGRWDSDDYLLWRIALKRKGVSLVSLNDPATAFETLADKIIALVIAERDRAWLLEHRRRCREWVKRTRKPGEPWGGARVVDPSRKGVRKLTDAQVQEAVQRAVQGETVTALALAYGMSRQHMSKILARVRRSTAA